MIPKNTKDGVDNKNSTALKLGEICAKYTRIGGTNFSDNSDNYEDSYSEDFRGIRIAPAQSDDVDEFDDFEYYESIYGNPFVLLVSAPLARTGATGFYFEEYLDEYLFEDKELEERIGTLGVPQRVLLNAFLSAITRESVDGDAALEVANSIADLSYSGRLSELFELCDELASMPPTRAPELWPGRAEAAPESPGDFIARVYGYWLERGRMHQAVLGQVDKKLLTDYRSWLRFNEPPRLVKEGLPSKADYQTRQVEQGLRKRLNNQSFLSAKTYRKQ